MGNRQAGRTHNYMISRLAALESRAMKKATLTNVLYLPIIFFGYGFLLGMPLKRTRHNANTITHVDCRESMYVFNATGTVYLQTTEPFLIMSGFCVYSVASALFMFPALYTFHTQALAIYTFERADGAGRATDLVIQPFVRFISMAFFPVIICAGVLYLLVRHCITVATYCINVAVYVIGCENAFNTRTIIIIECYRHLIVCSNLIFGHSCWIFIAGIHYSFSR